MLSRCSSALLALSVLALAGCPDFRAGATEETDAAALVDAGAPDVIVPDERAKGLLQVPDLPMVNYRGVWAVSPNRVAIVGDETILDYVDGSWNVTVVGGSELHGVWGDGEYMYAVGTFKQTNTGVIMLKTRKDRTWVQLATVPHGLRSVWGEGTFRMASGHDGVAYFGYERSPFKEGVQNDPIAGAPNTLFAPIMSSVGGNSRSHVIAAAGPGGWFGYDGKNWKAFAANVDKTRSFRSVWGPPGDALDVIIGANYYGLWRFKGAKDANGKPIPTSILHEERSDPLRANQFINGIWGASQRDFLAVGTGGRLIVFREKPDSDGVSILKTAAGARDLWSISGTNVSDVWIVGDDGVVLHGAVE